VLQRLAVRFGVSHSWAQKVRKLNQRLKNKSLLAVERDTDANRKQRAEFITHVAAIAPERLILLDESGVAVSMTRRRGRCLGGCRIHETTPDNWVVWFRICHN
jgi:hypothetical protein